MRSFLEVPLLKLMLTVLTTVKKAITYFSPLNKWPDFGTFTLAARARFFFCFSEKGQPARIAI